MLEIRWPEIVAARRADAGDLDHVAEYADPERAEEGFAHGAARDPRGGLARAGALEDVAHVG